jgi:hypothetical protein
MITNLFVFTLLPYLLARRADRVDRELRAQRDYQARWGVLLAHTKSAAEIRREKVRCTVLFECQSGLLYHSPSRILQTRTISMEIMY